MRATPPPLRSQSWLLLALRFKYPDCLDYPRVPSHGLADTVSLSVNTLRLCRSRKISTFRAARFTRPRLLASAHRLRLIAAAPPFPPFSAKCLEALPPLSPVPAVPAVVRVPWPVLPLPASHLASLPCPPVISPAVTIRQLRDATFALTHSLFEPHRARPLLPPRLIPHLI